MGINEITNEATNGTTHMTATWPFFLNQAYRPDDLQSGPSVVECSRLPEAEIAPCFSKAGQDPWNKGEEAAVNFLTDVTGESCQITGGYEDDNADVNKIVMEGNKTVSLLCTSGSPSRSSLFGNYNVAAPHCHPPRPHKRLLPQRFLVRRRHPQ
jgi:hypothetical protein